MSKGVYYSHFDMLIVQGLVEEEKVDSCSVPFYAPLLKGTEDVVGKDRSFAIDHIQVYELNTTRGIRRRMQQPHQWL